MNFILVGYGEIFPITIFGRILITIACILGTILVSVLVVFINDFFSFDDVENKLFNIVLQESKDKSVINKVAGKIIFNLMLYNFLLNRRAKKTKYYRFKMLIEQIFLIKNFKLVRLEHSKTIVTEADYLLKIKSNISGGLLVMNKSINALIEDGYLFKNLKNQITENSEELDKIIKNTNKLNNMQLVLNDRSKLKNISKVDEILDIEADFTEEIMIYNRKYKGKVNSNTNTKKKPKRWNKYLKKYVTDSDES